MTCPHFCADLYDRLMTQLAAIEGETPAGLRRAELSIHASREIIIELHGVVNTHVFTDKKEETYFFKEVRPSFYSQLIYHTRVYQIELGKPPGDRTVQLGYLHKEFIRLKEFYEDNRFIYKYLRSGSTHLDDKLFFRPTEESAYAFRMYSFIEEPSFPTNLDPLVAQVKAADLLQLYLSDAINELDPPQTEQVYKRQLVWTESKTGLIEVAYALHAAGVFNSGKADLKEITDALEYIFQTDLRNYPRTFQEILSRKTGYTNFIDKLKEKLLLRIKIIEDKHIR
jgi:hypothetical protein